MEFRVFFNALWEDGLGPKLCHAKFFYDFMQVLAEYIGTHCHKVSDLDKLMKEDVIAGKGKCKPGETSSRSLFQQAKDNDKTLWSRDIRSDNVKKKLRDMINAEEGTEGFKLLQAFGAVVLKFSEAKTDVLRVSHGFNLHDWFNLPDWLDPGDDYGIQLFGGDLGQPLILPHSMARALGSKYKTCDDITDFSSWPSHKPEPKKRTSKADEGDVENQHIAWLKLKRSGFTSDTSFLTWVKAEACNGESSETTSTANAPEKATGNVTLQYSQSLPVREVSEGIQFTEGADIHNVSAAAAVLHSMFSQGTTYRDSFNEISSILSSSVTTEQSKEAPAVEIPSPELGPMSSISLVNNANSDWREFDTSFDKIFEAINASGPPPSPTPTPLAHKSFYRIRSSAQQPPKKRVCHELSDLSCDETIP